MDLSHTIRKKNKCASGLDCDPENNTCKKIRDGECISSDNCFGELVCLDNKCKESFLAGGNLTATKETTDNSTKAHGESNEGESQIIRFI